MYNGIIYCKLQVAQGEDCTPGFLYPAKLSLTDKVEDIYRYTQVREYTEWGLYEESAREDAEWIQMHLGQIWREQKQPVLFHTEPKVASLPLFLSGWVYTIWECVTVC